ncbi:hypothetical protein [Jannaschia ovalis]|uniref:Uncharacterized protein n=1 Tax=Jannaschia ovalis TaxID=3038773 RepID=A0ABY8LE62_9RHOB|nr:hypothetical protein [Jannaschia sp. GRR-S6-38]WGH78350.1 hypothetical protein P8627_15200 [Jannaschia sp. GRR-S6-38]
MEDERGGEESCSDMARRRVAAALRSVAVVHEILDLKAQQFAEAAPGADLDLEDILKLQRELSKAVVLAMEQEGKLTDARRIERGGDELDLEAARLEIGCRLARIRERG